MSCECAFFERVAIETVNIVIIYVFIFVPVMFVLLLRGKRRRCSYEGT